MCREVFLSQSCLFGELYRQVASRLQIGRELGSRHHGLRPDDASGRHISRVRQTGWYTTTRRDDTNIVASVVNGDKYYQF